MGLAEPHSTVLALERETMIVPLRRLTLRSWDACLYALRPSIPGQMRSSSHGFPRRHGISRLLDLQGPEPARKTVASYPCGFFHMAVAKLRTGDGRLYVVRSR
jgi:hypothetical protein